METDFKEVQNIVGQQPMKTFLPFGDKAYNILIFQHYLQYQQEELAQYGKEIDFQFSNVTDEELTLHIDMRIDSWCAYSQHQFDVGKTRQNFHASLKPNVELKQQRPIELPLLLKKIGETASSCHGREYQQKNGRRQRNGITICQLHFCDVQK